MFSSVLAGLAIRAPLLGDGLVLVDVDDTIVEVHGYAKQGAAFGYSRVRGLNALLATASTATPRRWWWRSGCAGVVRVAARRETAGRRCGRRRCPGLTPGRPMLLRADSAFYGRDTIAAAIRAGR